MTREALTGRAQRELIHGRKLAQSDTEKVWGWDTAAGRIRARRRAAMISDRAHLHPGMSILEVGCGSGIFTAFFAESGASILAVDISPELLRLALNRNLPEDRVRFLAIPFEDESIKGPFDAVIGSSILHHLDIGPTLTRIWRLLAPGGVMAFAEPNMLNPQIMVQKNVAWIKEKMGDSPDETAFWPWTILRQLHKAEFADIDITPFDWLHPLTPPSLLGTINAMGNFLEKMPLIRHFAGSLLIAARKPDK